MAMHCILMFATHALLSLVIIVVFNARIDVVNIIPNHSQSSTISIQWN